MNHTKTKSKHGHKGTTKNIDMAHRAAAASHAQAELPEAMPAATEGIAGQAGEGMADPTMGQEAPPMAGPGNPPVGFQPQFQG